MYQQKGKTALNGKLDNIKALSAHLNEPETKFRSIHVAGTNGKGSSSHMLASILQEAGYKVGLYTSPHLKDFRERIKINGKCVSKNFVIDFISDNRPFLEQYKLSFFEMTVGMAFALFAKKKVDIAIIEVGLGGRLDSTNIITPEVSLITNIGYDHVDILGDTIEKIAYEKAGIIKNGIPVVVSETQKETIEVFKAIAKEKNAKVIFADKAVETHFETSLLGSYQKKNVKGVVCAISLLSNLSIKPEHIAKGLLRVVENTGLLGRWQILQENPKVVCDTAHNAEGLCLVIGQIEKEEFDRLHIVLGFVKDKDLDAVLPLFPTNATYYFSGPKMQRGLDSAILMERAKEFGLKGVDFESVAKALQMALKNAKPADLIYVGGSTFVVAEVL